MTTPNITLNNGVEMPQLGLGVYQMDDQQVRDSIPLALKAGYRLIDTASRYYNERLSDKRLRTPILPVMSCSSPPSCGSKTMVTIRQNRHCRSRWITGFWTI